MVRLALLLSLCLVSVGCLDSNTPTVEREKKVEIAPGKWLVVSAEDTVYAEPEDESSSLSFKWNGKVVKWRGKEIPITLREHGGTLYMIGFNREDLRRCKFVTFQLNGARDGFAKIKPAKFPKQIATQNMWLSPRSRYVNVAGQRVDKWQVLRKLDIENPYFTTSYTARIWAHLVTGKQYHELDWPDEAFVREYVKKYKPIALPTIVKEPKESDGQEKKAK